VAPLDLAARGALHFGGIDGERFPALGVALEAGRRGDTTAAALSGADEVAVEHFLAGRLRFTDIARLLARVLDEHPARPQPTLQGLLAAESWGREYVEAAVAAGAR
jgi:1-deoxy-D-xylulose-5-phosphate reductoisomerase